MKIKSFLKRDFGVLIEGNEMDIFSIKSSNLEIEEVNERPIYEYFVRFKNEEKKKTKNFIFLFHHLVFIVERNFLKKKKSIFLNLYDNFYS